MYHVSIAMGLYNVRWDLAKDFEGTLKKVAEMGYDGVEFAQNFGGRSAAEIRGLCEKYGLIPFAAHIPVEHILEDESWLSFYKELGIEFAVIPYFPEEYSYRSKNWPEVARRLNEAQKVWAENGMTMVELSYKWLLSKPWVTSILCGVSKLSQMEENVTYSTDTPLCPEIIEKCDSVWPMIHGSYFNYHR